MAPLSEIRFNNSASEPVCDQACTVSPFRRPEPGSRHAVDPCPVRPSPDMTRAPRDRCRDCRGSSTACRRPAPYTPGNASSCLMRATSSPGDNAQLLPGRQLRPEPLIERRGDVPELLPVGDVPEPEERDRRPRMRNAGRFRTRHRGRSGRLLEKTNVGGAGAENRGNHRHGGRDTDDGASSPARRR